MVRFLQKINQFALLSIPEDSSHNCEQEFITLSIIFRVTVKSHHVNLMGTNFPISKIHCHLLYGMVSYIKLHCDLPDHHSSVLFEECINFLLIVFTCSAPHSTTVWLMGDVHISIFIKSFTHILTLALPMQSCPYTQ